MVNKGKGPTPLDFAKAVARIKPDLEAFCLVRSFTPKGKGGWGLTEKVNELYIAGGNAALRMGRKIGRSAIQPALSLWTENGPCQVCNHIIVDRKGRRMYFLPDPRVGQPTKNEPNEVYYKYAKVMACDACAAQHPDWLTDIGWYTFAYAVADDYEVKDDAEGKPIRYLCAIHPDYASGIKTDWMKVYIDLRLLFQLRTQKTVVRILYPNGVEENIALDLWAKQVGVET